MTDSKPDAPESVPEPESIQEIRKILTDVGAAVDRGEIEEISIYAANRDGDYLTYQSRDVGRHQDAGRILELALIRLGFVQKEDLDRVVDQL